MHQPNQNSEEYFFLFAISEMLNHDERRVGLDWFPIRELPKL